MFFVVILVQLVSRVRFALYMTMNTWFLCLSFTLLGMVNLGGNQTPSNILYTRGYLCLDIGMRVTAHDDKLDNHPYQNSKTIVVNCQARGEILQGEGENPSVLHWGGFTLPHMAWTWLGQFP